MNPKLKKYLDNFYLGFFNGAHYKQFVSRACVLKNKDSYLFYFQKGNYAPEGLPREVSVLLFPQISDQGEVEYSWKCFPDLNSSFLNERSIRCAVFFHLEDLNDDLDFPLDKRKIADGFLEERLENLNQHFKRLEDFRLRKSKQLVEVPLDLKSQPVRNLQDLEESLLDLELASHKKKPLAAPVLKAQFSLRIEFYMSGDIQIIPTLLPDKSKAKRPLPMTRHQMTRYEVVNFPEGLRPLIEAHLEMHQEGNPYRLKREQWAQLLQPTLMKILPEIENGYLFGKQDSEVFPLVKARPIKLGLEFYPSTFRKAELEWRVRINLEDGSEVLTTKLPFLTCSEHLCGFFLLNRPIPLFVCFENSPTRPYRQLFEFLESHPFVPASEFEKIRSGLASLPLHDLHISNRILQRYQLTLEPIPRLKFLLPGKSAPAYLKLHFDYESPRIEFEAKEKTQGILETRPNPEFESLAKLYIERLEGMNVLPSSTRVLGSFFDFTMEEDAFREFLFERAEDLIDRGFELYHIKQKKKLAHRHDLKLEKLVKNKGGWLRIQPQLRGKGVELPVGIEEIRSGFVQNQEGELVLLGKDDLEELEPLIGSPFEGAFPESFLPELESHFGKLIIPPPLFRKHEKQRKIMADLKKDEGYPLPENLGFIPRSYQAEGYQFLQKLHDLKMPGILADHMGLGKTFQCLMYLKRRFELGLKRFLVIAPVSALENWKIETERSVPGLPVHIYHGSNRDRESLSKMEGLILSSYALLRLDQKYMEEKNWDVLVLDEAQHIKNPGAAVTRAAKNIPSTQRLCLTGTPMENNSLEYFSLFEFLKPGFLGNRKWFIRTFATPIERVQAELSKSLLRKITSPYMLRRRKEDVESSLPDKTEVITHLNFTKEQKEAYKKTLKYYKDRLKKQIKDSGVDGAGVYVLEGILRLRQVCLDPQLANPAFAGIESAKLAHLSELLPGLCYRGHKVLIFSQFQKVLQRVEEVTRELCFETVVLDGSKSRKSRQIAIEQFQNDEDTRVFLISLKAGGTALNLTAADYVILLDPWWNPAVENQAIDRAHRIGQTKGVIVYRLVMSNSIEEDVIKLAERKKVLFDELIEGTGLSSPLEIRELMNLLDPDWSE